MSFISSSSIWAKSRCSGSVRDPDEVTEEDEKDEDKMGVVSKAELGDDEKDDDGTGSKEELDDEENDDVGTTGSKAELDDEENDDVGTNGSKADTLNSPLPCAKLHLEPKGHIFPLM